MEEIDKRIIEAVNGHRHEHYDFMVEMADWCKAVMTGEGQEAMIRDIRPEESKENKDQRVQVSVPRTPEILGSAETIFRKTFRVDGVKGKYGVNSEGSAKVKVKMQSFYGHQSAYNYLSGQQLYYEFNDPNTWGIVEYEREVTKEGVLIDVNPYPLEVTTREAIDYEYQMGSPVYLCVLRKRWEVDSTNAKVKLETYTAYGIGQSVVYKEVLSVSEDTEAYVHFKEDKDPRYFEVYRYQTGTRDFPGGKFGAYRCRSVSDASVKEPPYYRARFVLERVVKGGSLKDVCKWKHVYPKCFGIDFDCAYEIEGEHCVKGYIGGDKSHECPNCGGTGSMLHSSELDNVRYTLSPAAEKNEVIPAEYFYSYARAPLEETKWISDDLDKDTMLVLLAIFNTQQEQAPVVPTTATAELLNWENVNNEVFTFANHTSFLLETFVRTISDLLEVGDVEYNHTYPKNLGLQPERSLITRLGEARNSSAPVELIEAIECEIMSKRFSDDPLAVDRWQALERHRPMREKEESVAMSLMGLRDHKDVDRILFENWSKVKLIVSESYPQFSKPGMTIKKQRQILKEIALDISTQVKYVESDIPVFGASFSDGADVDGGIEEKPLVDA